MVSIRNDALRRSGRTSILRSFCLISLPKWGDAHSDLSATRVTRPDFYLAVITTDDIGYDSETNSLPLDQVISPSSALQCEFLFLLSNALTVIFYNHF